MGDYYIIFSLCIIGWSGMFCWTRMSFLRINPFIIVGPGCLARGLHITGWLMCYYGYSKYSFECHHNHTIHLIECPIHGNVLYTLDGSCIINSSYMGLGISSHVLMSYDAQILLPTNLYVGPLPPNNLSILYYRQYTRHSAELSK